MENITPTHRPIRVSKDYARALKVEVESFKNFKPIWWTYYSSRVGCSDVQIIKEFSNYCVRVARNTGAHILPVYSIGRIPGKRPHIHCVMCADHYIDYRDLHGPWRSGFSEQKLYNSRKQGFQYLCDYERTHRLVVGVQPFCPNKGKCKRRGCVYARGREC